MTRKSFTGLLAVLSLAVSALSMSARAQQRSSQFFIEPLSDAKGQVGQERGLHFLGEKDAKYTDLVLLQDPFEYNPGMKGGTLVEARYGRGRWLYVGLGLWRQLPYGTVGAYQLMANLISLGKVPKAASGGTR